MGKVVSHIGYNPLGRWIVNREGLIKNGSYRTSTGYVQVSLDKNLNLMPVVYAVHSGYAPDRGTLQLPGDVLRYEYDRRSDEWFWNYDKIPDTAPVIETVFKKYPLLRDVFRPHGRGGVWLPEEYCPPEEYLAVKSKRRRVTNFLTRFGLTGEYTVEDFMRSPGRLLNLTPKPLDIDLSTYEVEEEYASGSKVDIARYERWFEADGDGSPAEEITLQPTVKAVTHGGGSHYTNSAGVPGIRVSGKKKFLVRIEHGACTDRSRSGNYSYGYRIVVYAL